MNINKWIGIPYIVFESDCWSIVRNFAKDELGIEYPQFFYDTSNNDQVAQGVMLSVDALGQRWKQVDEYQLGDVILFRICGFVRHCGLYLQDGDFLHSLEGRHSCIENLTDSNWSRRVYKVYRWLGS